MAATPVLLLLRAVTYFSFKHTIKHILESDVHPSVRLVGQSYTLVLWTAYAKHDLLGQSPVPYVQHHARLSKREQDVSLLKSG